MWHRDPKWADIFRKCHPQTCSMQDRHEPSLGEKGRMAKRNKAEYNKTRCTCVYAHAHMHTLCHKKVQFWGGQYIYQSSITRKLWSFFVITTTGIPLRKIFPTPALYKYPSKIALSVFLGLFLTCKYLKHLGWTLHGALSWLSSPGCQRAIPAPVVEGAILL